MPDPNSGNAFWNAPHTWLMADEPFEFNTVYYAYEFPTYSQGYFSVSTDSQFDDVFMNYTPTAVPEPGSGLLLGVTIFGWFASRRAVRRRR